MDRAWTRKRYACKHCQKKTVHVVYPRCKVCTVCNRPNCRPERKK